MQKMLSFRLLVFLAGSDSSQERLSTWKKNVHFFSSLVTAGQHSFKDSDLDHLESPRPETLDSQDLEKSTSSSEL